MCSIFGSVIWPCVPIVVPEEQQGTTYGLMTTFQNSGQFMVPLILQHLFGMTHSYLPCEQFFINFSALAIVACIILLYVDETSYSGVLRLTEKAHARRKQELAAAALAGGYSTRADFNSTPHMHRDNDRQHRHSALGQGTCSEKGASEIELSQSMGFYSPGTTPVRVKKRSKRALRARNGSCADGGKQRNGKHESKYRVRY